MAKNSKFLNWLFSSIVVSPMMLLALSATTTTNHIVTQQQPSEIINTVNNLFPQEDADNQNLLVGKKATASLKNEDAKNGIDGNFATSWTSSFLMADDTKTNNITYEVDLGGLTQIKSLKVWFEFANLNDFAFEYLDDKSSEWKTIARVRNQASSKFFSNFSSQISATKIRIRFIDWSNAFTILDDKFTSLKIEEKIVGIREFGVYKYDLETPKETNPNLLEDLPSSVTSGSKDKNGQKALDNIVYNPDTIWAPKNFTDKCGTTDGICLGHQLFFNLEKALTFKSFRLILKTNNVSHIKISAAKKDQDLSTIDMYNKPLKSSRSSFIVFNLNEPISDIKTLNLNFLNWDGAIVEVLDFQGYAHSIPYNNKKEYFDYEFLQALNKADVNNYTSDSITTYTENLNKIKAEFEADTNPQSENITDYVSKLLLNKDLVTYKQSLSKIVKDFENQISLDNYDKSTITEYMTQLANTKTAIDTNLRFNRSTFEEISTKLLNAKNSLRLLSDLTISTTVIVASSLAGGFVFIFILTFIYLINTKGKKRRRNLKNNVKK